MNHVTVVNKKNIVASPDDVYIGRGSVWGNPYRINRVRTRAKAVEAYRRYLWTRPDLLGRLDELRGKRLVCHCAPEACHGDVLVRAIAWKDAGGELPGDDPPAPPESQPYRVAFTGDRNWSKEQPVLDLIKRYDDAALFVLGDARGLDTIARVAVEQAELPSVLEVADWERLGRAAGHIRNSAMLDHLEPGDILLAFHHDPPSSKGTTNCVEQAVSRGIQVHWTH